jgi:hypothetical protein
MIVMRDSKAPRRMLPWTIKEWRAFVRRIKAGEFDA